MPAIHIRTLATRLGAAAPTDASEQREIFERIRDLRSAFDGPLDPETHRCLEAAGMLVAYLARMGALAGEDVRAIAVRLLQCAADAEIGAGTTAAAEAAARHGLHRIPSTPPPAPPAPAAVAPAPPAEEERTATDVLGDMLLGQILLQRGHILEEHIHQAMKVQRATFMRIGDIFVKIGACSREKVAEALNHQASLRRVRENLGEIAIPKADRADMRGTGLKLVGEAMLGEILIERNVVTRRQLERALEAQKQTGARIGEALVKIGATTLEQIEQALRVQSRERRMVTGNPPAKGDEKR